MKKNTFKKLGVLSLLLFLSLQAKAADLYINEISGNAKWIELYNSGSSQVNLSGYILQKIDELGIQQNWTIPSGTTIPAGGFVSWTQGTNQSTTFTWGISGKKDVAFKLFTPNKAQQLDYFEVRESLYSEGLQRTVGRRTNGGAELVIFKNGGTKGASNNTGTIQVATPAGERKKLYVNEISGNGKWVEIYNAENAEVDLTDYSIRKIDETGSFDNWFFPSGTKIGAKAFRAWTQDAYNLDGSTFTWGISGKKDVAFKIFDNNGTELDYFEVRENLYSEGLSRTVGRETDGAAGLVIFKNEGTKAASNNTGTIQIPTPAGERKKLYVNEINGNENWLEVYNSEGAEVDLTGYSIRKIDETGSIDNWFFPSGTKIAGKGFRFWTQNINCIDGSTFTWGISPKKDVAFKIFDANGTELDYFEVRSDLYSEGGTQSVGRKNDGATILIIFAQGTPGASNGNVSVTKPELDKDISAYADKGVLYLSGNVTSVSVISVLGITVLSQDGLSGGEIGAGHLPSGIYLVRISDGKQIKTQKIVLGGQ